MPLSARFASELRSFVGGDILPRVFSDGSASVEGVSSVSDGLEALSSEEPGVCAGLNPSGICPSKLPPFPGMFPPPAFMVPMADNEMADASA